MGSMTLDLLRSAHGHGNRLGTAFWAAKLVFALLGLFSTVFLVRLALPLSRDLVGSTLPRLYAAARGYLGAPYIFLVVNFMILVILKLPDTRNHNHRKESPGGGAAAETPPKPRKDLPPSSPREISSSAWSDAAGDEPVPASSTKIGESWPGCWSDASCLTEDLEGDTAVSSPAAVVVQSSALEIGVAASDKASLPMDEDEEDEDSMDATWKAITGGEPGRRQLKKNQTWGAPPPVRLQPAGEPAARRDLRKSETFRERSAAAATVTRRVVVERRMTGREVPVAEDHDDMNRQFEAFIKKVNDQMRLQREESAAQRYMEMVNSSG